MTHQAWKVLGRESVLQHPNISVDMEAVQLPDGRVIKDWPIARTQDYVSAFVINEDGLALVLEGYRHGLGRNSWQVLGGYLRDGEDPGDGVARLLLETIGYKAGSWRHLASLVTDADQHVGVGHFFLGRNLQQIVQPKQDGNSGQEIKWVRLAELKRALWDGRIAGASYATAVSMGLLAIGCY
ncbi:MAG: NUDIX hydrolase [Anaerolineales bacterium]|nr:NUDIX hydrolase [Anaerolineales bacterium]